MKQYLVFLTEYRERMIEISAENESQAETIVNYLYQSGRIHLTDDDLEDLDIIAYDKDYFPKDGLENV